MSSLVTVTASGRLPPMAKPVAARSATYRYRFPPWLGLGWWVRVRVRAGSATYRYRCAPAAAEASPSTAVRLTLARKERRLPATSAL